MIHPKPFGELPALPIVVPLGLLLFAVLVWRLSARRLLSLPRAAVAAALSVYAAGIIANTVFPIFLDKPDTGEPWSPALALVPFFDYEVDDALMNIAVFVPLGILLPLILTRPSWRRVLPAVAGASLSIELLQLAAQGLFSGGHIADINDVIWNVSGGAVGYGLFVLVMRIPGLSALVDRFRWAQPGEASATRGGEDAAVAAGAGRR